MSLQIRRGTAAELAAIVPQSGEPIWTTDAKKLFVGDGLTLGGNLVTAAQDVSTTSNVTFANVNVTYTATVAAIRFGDGSVQTTADTANPDQSVNTTSNVRFNSAIIATTATVAVLRFGDGTEMITADTANPDQALNTTSDVTFNSIDITTDASILGNITGNHAVSNLGSDTNRFANLYAQNVFTYGTTAISGSAGNQIVASLDGGELKFLGGKGWDSKQGLPTLNQVLGRIRTSGWFGTVTSAAHVIGITAAGNWNTSTNVNYGANMAESVGIPNLKFTADSSLTLTGIFRQALWNNPISTFPQRMDLIEGFNLAPTTLAQFTNGIGTTTATNVLMDKYYLNSRLFLVGPPIENNDSTAAGQNIIRFVATRNSAATGGRQAVLANDTLGQIEFRGFRSGESPTTLPGVGGVEGARIQVNARRDFLSTQSFTSIALMTADLDSTLVQNRATFDSENITFTAKSVQAYATVGGQTLFNAYDTGISFGGAGGYSIEAYNGAAALYLNNLGREGITINPDGWVDIRRSNVYSGGNVMARFGTETSDFYYPGDTIGTDSPKLSIQSFGIRSADIYGYPTNELNLIGDQGNVNLKHFDGSDTVDTAVFNRTKIELKYPTAIEDIVHSGNSLTAINNTNTQDIFTFDSSVYNSAKFCVQIVDSGEIHFAELNVITDGTNVWKTEYGTNTSNGVLGTFSVAMDTGTCKLQFTPTAATSMNIRVSATLLAP